MLHALVTAANVQDRDGGILLLSTLFGQFPFLRKLFADSAYAGPIFGEGAANAMRSLVVEIVKRADGAKGFVVEPKRWIVERSIAWLNRCRRLAKGLGMPQPLRPRLPALALRPPYAPKALSKHEMIPDGL